MSEIEVRAASIRDAEGINAVYNPYIRESDATFETEAVSVEAREDWFCARTGNARHPVLVAEKRGGGICGFASANPFDARAGYATSVKTSVFVDRECLARGIGFALYQALFEVLDQANVHRAYGLIASPNPASVALHERFGFRHIATLDEVGMKFGRYIDVMWFEKRF